ncbi:MAG: hypothetical protein ACXWHB_10430 [Usitatibacter sp.]
MSAIAPERRWPLAAAAMVALVAILSAWLFAPLLAGYFVSDDFVPLVLFRLWEDQGRLASALAEKFWSSLDAGDSRFYRPLSYLSFALNYLTSGLDAAPWMAVNVALHVLNGVMVGMIGVRAAEGSPSARGIAAGALGAALFLFLAPGAEVVAWISGRFDGSATFFTLLACVFFQRSRRTGDAAGVASLLSAVAALLCKESAAIVPFAILFLARLRDDVLDRPTVLARWLAAARVAAPWLALAALYLAWRYAMFGSATRVYSNTQPLSDMLSRAYWSDVVQALPAWISAQFRPAYRFAFLAVLTLAQLVLIFVSRPSGRREPEALFGAAATVALTLALLLPHVGKLPEDGLSGRLLYQTSAFYGVLVAIALRHSRAAYLLWGVSLALLILHTAFERHVLARWEVVHRQTRELVPAVARYHDALAPGDFALVLVPEAVDDIPFGRNAQGGLMLPPVQPRALTYKVLVQETGELPALGGKIRDGVVTTLRRAPVFDFLAGKRVTTTPPEYPTRIACWSSLHARLVPLEVAPGPDPETWARSLKGAFARHCPQRPSTR